MEELLKQFMGQMDKRFEQIDKRFEQMDKRFDQIEQSMAGIKGEVQGLKGEVQELKVEVQGIKVEMANNQTENRSHFKHIESKLVAQQSTFQIVAEEIKGVKIDIDYLNGKMGKHDMEINNLNQRFQA